MEDEEIVVQFSALLPVINGLWIALVVLLIWQTFREGHIFEFWSRWLSDLPEKLQKPLHSCPICMTPWYGSILWVLFADNNFILYAMSILCAAGINVIIAHHFLKED